MSDPNTINYGPETRAEARNDEAASEEAELQEQQMADAAPYLYAACQKQLDLHTMSIRQFVEKHGEGAIERSVEELRQAIAMADGEER